MGDGGDRRFTIYRRPFWRDPRYFTNRPAGQTTDLDRTDPGIGLDRLLQISGRLHFGANGFAPDGGLLNGNAGLGGLSTLGSNTMGAGGWAVHADTNAAKAMAAIGLWFANDSLKQRHEANW